MILTRMIGVTSLYMIWQGSLALGNLIITITSVQGLPSQDLRLASEIVAGVVPPRKHRHPPGLNVKNRKK